MELKSGSSLVRVSESELESLSGAHHMFAPRPRASYLEFHLLKLLRNKESGYYICYSNYKELTTP